MDYRSAYIRRSRKGSRLKKRAAAIGLLGMAACAVLYGLAMQAPDAPALAAWTPAADTSTLAPTVLRTAAQVEAQNKTKRTRRVYPYSIVPGGLADRRELARAVVMDKVVAQHYAAFDASRATVEKVGKPRAVYVSYRKGDKVFWTAQKLQLAQGETLLSDGQNEIRTRCGNRISDVPQLPVEAKGPSAEELDSSVDVADDDAGQGAVQQVGFAVDGNPAGHRSPLQTFATAGITHIDGSTMTRSTAALANQLSSGSATTWNGGTLAVADKTSGDSATGSAGTSTGTSGTGTSGTGTTGTTGTGTPGTGTSGSGTPGTGSATPGSTTGGSNTGGTKPGSNTGGSNTGGTTTGGTTSGGTKPGSTTGGSNTGGTTSGGTKPGSTTGGSNTGGTTSGGTKPGTTSGGSNPGTPAAGSPPDSAPIKNGSNTGTSDNVNTDPGKGSTGTSDSPTGTPSGTPGGTTTPDSNTPAGGPQPPTTPEQPVLPPVDPGTKPSPPPGTLTPPTTNVPSLPNDPGKAPVKHADVPEPGTLWLAGAGVAALLAARRGKTEKNRRARD